MSSVDLQSGDVARLQQLVSHYQSWQGDWLNLRDLSAEDWDILGQLLQSLDSVWGVWIDRVVSVSEEILRQLWDKTSDWWSLKKN